MDNDGIITISFGAYQMLAQEGASRERRSIINWLRSAHQPMTHTAWALAKQIEQREHHDAWEPLDTRDARIAELEEALREIIACERLMHAGSTSIDIALAALGDDDDF